MSADLLAAALADHDHGLCVVPAQPGKRPWDRWKEYQTTRPTRDDIAEWFGPRNSYAGFGVICGAVSGSLEMFELEGRAVEEGICDEFVGAARVGGVGDLIDRIAGGYEEVTPSGGFHWLYRCEQIAPNMELACRPATDDELAVNSRSKVRVLIETRGEGGFVIVAPSNGTTHPTGGSWRLVRGGPATIATITADERGALHALARTFNRLSEKSITYRPRAAGSGDGDRPGDDYNNRATWEDVIGPHGWVHAYDHAETGYWRRPGAKTHNIDATTNALGTDRLKVFSTSTGDFETDTSYDKFGAYAVLNHGGDLNAAARQLRADGYGRRTASHTAHPIGSRDPYDPGPGEPPADDGQPDSELERDASWEPIDLGPAWRGEKTRPAATVFQRDDGIALLPPGINYLHGDSGDGKSFVALIATVAELQAGVPVIWLTYEDANEDLIVDRLRLLGATDEDVRFLIFIAPQEGLRLGADHVAELAADMGVRLLVLDSVGEAMAVSGVNEDKDAEVGPWFRQTARVIIDRATAVAIWPIDHSTKAKDNPLFPSGSKRKRAAVTGRAYMLNVRQPFGVGEIGYVQLVVAKDRGGTFRRGAIAAEIKLDATTTPYTVTISGPRVGDSYSQKPPRRNAEERVLEVLGESLVPLTAEHVARILNGPDRTRPGEGSLSFGSVKNALTNLAKGPEVRRTTDTTGPGRFHQSLWQTTDRDGNEP